MKRHGYENQLPRIIFENKNKEHCPGGVLLDVSTAFDIV